MLLLCGTALSVSAQNSKKDKVIQKMSAETCGCLERSRMDTISSMDSYKTLLAKCMTPAMLDNMDELQKAYKFKTIDSETGREIGYDVGIHLAKSCPVFTETAVRFAGKENEDVVPPTQDKTPAKFTPSGFISGTILRTEKSPQITFVVKEADGSETRIWWIERFGGSDALVDNPDAYNDKKVEISWIEKEIYQATEKKYIKVKMATHLRLVD